MSKYFKHIVIDSIDGAGKSTQIKLLKTYFESLGKTVLLTRGIGGPIGSEMELIRKFLFENHLNDKYIEEKVFAIAEEANLRWIKEQKSKYDNLVVLQDRGMMSHVVYGLAKDGLTLEELYHIFLDARNDFYGLETIDVILVPENADMVLKRINKRNSDSESVLSKKYENVAFQQRLLDIINDFGRIEAFFDTVVKINIKENDFKSEVSDRIIIALKDLI